MKRQGSPAILLFSRQAAREASRKRWLPGNAARRNKMIAGALLSHTLEVLHAADMPLYHFDERLQSGATFGERIAHAFASVFAQGHDYVICVGSDCPQLDQLDWGFIREQAFLKRGILGPDLRGGVYLIGMPKLDFKPLAFQQLPWQSPSLFKVFSAVYRDHCLLLESLRDLNGLEDIQAYLHSSASTRSLVQWLREWLWSNVRPLLSVRGFLYPAPIRSVRQLRAPPAVAQL